MKELFKKLGANEKEMNIYLKLLEIGPQPISIIAKQMHTPRSSMYVIVEKMKKLHLIEEFERAQIRYVKATSSHELKSILLIAENKIREANNLLEHYLPSLESLEHSSPIKPFVQHHEGKDAVMKLYEHIFEEKAYIGFFNPEKIVHTLGAKYLQVAEISSKHNSVVKEIATHSEEALLFKNKYSSSNHEIRILPPGISFDSDIIITDESIYMIAFQDHHTAGIEIHSKILATSMSIAFHGWWQNLEEDSSLDALPSHT